MLTKLEIAQKLKEIRQKTELLNLSNHTALGDFVLVVPAVIDEAGITTRARQMEDRPEIGIVTAVGEDVEHVSEGDVVFFGQYSHTQVTHDDITYLIMRSEDIYLVASNPVK